MWEPVVQLEQLTFWADVLVALRVPFEVFPAPNTDGMAGFTGAFCWDRIGLLNVLLAEDLNLGLGKLAEVSNTHDYFQLSLNPTRYWFIEKPPPHTALKYRLPDLG